jgi:hypothetical protein
MVGVHFTLYTPPCKGEKRRETEKQEKTKLESVDKEKLEFGREKKQISVRVGCMDPAHWRGKGNQFRPRFRTGQAVVERMRRRERRANNAEKAPPLHPCERHPALAPPPPKQPAQSAQSV